MPRFRATTRICLVIGLLIGGLVLMMNPLYLPITFGESDTTYTHVVQPVGPDSPAFDDASVIERSELDPDARAAFDRALDEPADGFVVTDADEQVRSLAYPTEPTLHDGLLIVAYEGDRYEFWTRTVERDPGIVVVQRLIVQPLGFLLGFFAILGAVAVAIRDRLSFTARE